MNYSSNDERVTREFEELNNRQEVSRLKKSKPLKEWCQFYEKCFGMEIQIDNNIVNLGQSPGHSLGFIPKEMTLEIAFKVLSERFNMKTNLIKPDDEVKRARRMDSSYIFYYRSKYQSFLLEDCLFLLKELHDSGKTSIGAYTFSLSRHVNGKNILIHYSSGPHNGHYELGIFTQEPPKASGGY